MPASHVLFPHRAPNMAASLPTAGTAHPFLTTPESNVNGTPTPAHSDSAARYCIPIEASVPLITNAWLSPPPMTARSGTLERSYFRNKSNSDKSDVYDQDESEGAILPRAKRLEQCGRRQMRTHVPALALNPLSSGEPRMTVQKKHGECSRLRSMRPFQLPQQKMSLLSPYMSRILQFYPARLQLLGQLSKLSMLTPRPDAHPLL